MLLVKERFQSDSLRWLSRCFRHLRISARGTVAVLDGTESVGEANRAQVLRFQYRRPRVLWSSTRRVSSVMHDLSMDVMVQWRTELGKSKLSLEQARSNTSDLDDAGGSCKESWCTHITLDGSGAIYMLALRTTDGVLASAHWRHAAPNRVKWMWRVEIGCCSSGAGSSDWKDPYLKHGCVVRPRSGQRNAFGVQSTPPFPIAPIQPVAWVLDFQRKLVVLARPSQEEWP